MTDYRDEVGRRDVALRVRAWPLELVNGEPLSRELLVEEIAELRRSVAPKLFAGFDRDLFPMSSLPALALAARAYRADSRIGERVSLALREALFEQGHDIADPDELARIGDAFGIGQPDADDEAAVIRDLTEGRGRKVIGSPHFFVGTQDFFCPSLELERVDDHLRIAIDLTEFGRFVDHCFAADRH